MRKALRIDPRIAVIHSKRRLRYTPPWGPKPRDAAIVLGRAIEQGLLRIPFTIVRARELRRQRELERAKQEKD